MLAGLEREPALRGSRPPRPRGGAAEGGRRCHRRNASSRPLTLNAVTGRSPSPPSTVSDTFVSRPRPPPRYFVVFAAAAPAASDEQRSTTATRSRCRRAPSFDVLQADEPEGDAGRRRSAAVEVEGPLAQALERRVALSVEAEPGLGAVDEVVAVDRLRARRAVADPEAGRSRRRASAARSRGRSAVGLRGFGVAGFRARLRREARSRGRDPLRLDLAKLAGSLICPGPSGSSSANTPAAPATMRPGRRRRPPRPLAITWLLTRLTPCSSGAGDPPPGRLTNSRSASFTT